MKKAPQKIHRNFKIPAVLDGKLRKESEKSKLTQTAIVELALTQWFAVKR